MATDTMKHSYVVTGMSCESCANKIADALQKIPGVSSTKVTLNPPEAHLEMRGHVATDILNDAVKQVGTYQLTEKQGATNISGPSDAEAPESLYPLFLIVGYILATVGFISIVSGDYSIPFLMNNFMAGFFLVFSFFKLLDLRGFVDAYRSYDLFAQALPIWGFIYPFIELALGIAYILHLHPTVTNWITLVLMLIGSAGVLRALLNKKAISCACLGTALKLPMTKVTLIEDMSMAVMAAAMLVILG